MSNVTQATALDIKISETTIDQAIDWAIKLNFNSPNKAIIQTFDSWLERSLEHQVAWQRVNSMQDEFRNVSNKLPNHSPSHLPSNSPNVASDKIPKQSANALVLSTLKIADQQRADSGLTRRQTLKLLSLCIVGISSGYLLKEQTPWQRLLADVSTKVGEQRNLTLDDGTELKLNSDTAISIKFTDQQRLIVLRRGELFINTGKDNNAANKRLLLVQTPFGEVQPIGTRFIVRLNEHDAKVTVQQGAVKLVPSAGNKSSTNIVPAGETWLLSAQQSQLAPAQVISPTAWLDGSIAGNNMPLHLLLAELARYRVGIIRCDDNIKNLPVSGVYHLADTDKTLLFLQQSYAVKVRTLSRFLVMVSAKNS